MKKETCLLMNIWENLSNYFKKIDEEHRSRLEKITYYKDLLKWLISKILTKLWKFYYNRRN